MFYQQITSETQFIVQLTTLELEGILQKVVAEALCDNLVGAPNRPIPDERLLSIEELCRKLQVSRHVVYRLRKKRRLPQYLVGNRKFFKFSEVLQSLHSTAASSQLPNKIINIKPVLK